MVVTVLTAARATELAVGSVPNIDGASLEHLRFLELSHPPLKETSLMSTDEFVEPTHAEDLVRTSSTDTRFRGTIPG